MAKNETNNQNAVELLLSRRLQLVLTLITLLGMFASIYLVAKLAPVNQSIALNALAISTNAEDIKKVEEEHYDLDKKIDELIKGQAEIRGILLAE